MASFFDSLSPTAAPELLPAAKRKYSERTKTPNPMVAHVKTAQDTGKPFQFDVNGDQVNGLISLLRRAAEELDTGLKIRVGDLVNLTDKKPTPVPFKGLKTLNPDGKYRVAYQTGAKKGSAN